MISKLVHKIQQQIRLGTITAIYNKYGIVRAQVVVLDEAPEDVILLQPYGQNSCPPVGSLVEIFVNFANSENKYAIPYNPQDTPVLKVGESVLYNHFGSQVYLKEDGSIDILPKSGANINIISTADVNITAENANITATNTTIDGDVQITGNLVVDGDSTLTGAGTEIAGKVFLTHLHSGVTTGVDNTGGVV